MLIAVALLTAWLAPVPGHVTRFFDLGANPFAAGRHRGADFAARPGAPVRAACSGRVVVAGRVGTSGRVVTLRCGPYRVTALPLATVTVRLGASLGEGERIGTAGHSPAHAGVHLGVRRATERFGYVDPLRLLGRPHAHAPPIGPAARARPREPGGGPAVARSASERPEPSSAARPAPGWQSRSPATPDAAGRRGSSPIAPWPVWVGLGLAALGAVGTAAVRVPRTRRSALGRPSAEQVR